MRTILIIVMLLGLAIATAALAAGCAGDDRPRAGAGDQRLRVVATTTQVQDFARQVGGDRVEVTGILDVSAEAHGYEPTPSDAEAVADADLVVFNGAGLDAWLGDLLAQAGAEAPRVEAARGTELLPTEEQGFSGDPHVWHDPELAKRMVDNVAAGMVEADPAGRTTYRRNARAYKAEIERMSTTIRRRFASVPPERRDLVTSHDAFAYFARAYDVNVVGSVLPAVTTESEPSARQVRRLVDDIRAQGVTTIFTEQGVDPRLERRVAEEAGARVSTSLYADSLGPPGSPGATYIGAELANARAMQAAWRRP